MYTDNWFNFPIRKEARHFLFIRAVVVMRVGRAYDNLAQSQQEGTLKARMFAGINIERARMLDD